MLDDSGIAAAAILAAGLVVVVINLAYESRVTEGRRDEVRSKEFIAKGESMKGFFFPFFFSLCSFSNSITEYPYCTVLYFYFGVDAGLTMRG